MAKATRGSSDSGWRQRWADRENDGRRRAYDAALREWRQEDGELQQFRALAARFRGSADPALAPWLRLGRDEVVLCTMPNVRLVDAPGTGALPAPDPMRFPYPFEAAGARVLPPGVTVSDTGAVVITSHRMVFRGERTKSEWAYTRLEGVAHDRSAPVTLLRVAYREAVTGLLVPEGQVENFRFNLTLAIAHANSERTAFVGLLDERIAAHHRRAPAAFVTLSPQDAPVRAAFGRTQVGLAGVGVVVLLAGIFAVQAIGIGGGQGTPGAAGTSPALEVPSQVGVAVSTDGPTATPELTATGTPSATASPSRSPSKRPTPNRTTAKATTKPTPKHTTPAPPPPRADLCGAPQNPYGYNYCGRGALIHDPKPDVCSYFECVANFPDSRGFLVQCRDGKISLSGGQRWSCSRHGGPSRAVFQ